MDSYFGVWISNSSVRTSFRFLDFCSGYQDFNLFASGLLFFASGLISCRHANWHLLLDTIANLGFHFLCPANTGERLSAKQQIHRGKGRAPPVCMIRMHRLNWHEEKQNQPELAWQPSIAIMEAHTKIWAWIKLEEIKDILKHLEKLPLKRAS